MARERMVTRTINEVTAQVVVLNTNTLESQLVSVKMGQVEDTKKMLAMAKKILTPTLTEGQMVVAIKSFDTQEVRYGLPEAEFMKYATIIPNLPTK